MDQIELLPAQLARRNWIILAILLLGSLPFGNLALSLGILTGGLIAIGGFLWLRRSLDRLLGQVTDGQATGGTRFSYMFGCFLRLAVLAVILLVLIAIVKIHAIGLVIGLSVVVINLFWMTAQRAL
ncbi:MAG: ATP synthase subunit I [Desulfuromonadales bacterium]|nr:ATP synthase subunit I [Desulfuromonadales bacterium]